MGVGFGGQGGWRGFKAVFGVVLLVSVCLLLVETLASEESEGGASTTTSSPSNLRDDDVLVGKGRHFVAKDPHLIYTSKRKIPSGPDPIHNRHIGETKRPPGRV